MTIPAVENPIINFPYAAPQYHWNIRRTEAPRKVEGRRAPTYIYTPPGGVAGVPYDDDPGYEESELKLVADIRARLDEWRPLALRGEGGVSRITMELLKHWQREGRAEPLFFAQREAAETVIFLTEARHDFLQGIEVPPDTPGEDKRRQGYDGFRRLCCRMATGSGKTTVMAMLAAWSILNKVNQRGDRRYADAVLVICPNVTIRERLAELDPKHGDASLYRTRDLVPPAMMSDLRQGRVLTVNWHGFEPRAPHGGAKVVKAGRRLIVRETVFIGPKTTTARGRRYMTEVDLRKKHALGLLEILDEISDKGGALKKVAIRAERHVESDRALVRRVLEKELGTRGNLLVFNDEAHHAYRLRPDDEDTMDLFGEEDIADRYYKEATVWVDGLDRVHKIRGINFCVDFSATPYFLGKAGGDTNRIFPWTVSSFDLQDAIEAGLVKIPQLAVRDSSGAEVPGYFNIWKWLSDKLTASERGGKRSNVKPEAVLRYAHTPIAMMGGLWDKLRREWGQSDEKRPPVFILVCKTKNLAQVVYEWLADDCPPGQTSPSADLPELRNSAEQQNTICVYSDMQAEIDSGNAKSDDNRWMRYTLDTIGRLDWTQDDQGRPHYPEGFAALADKLGMPKHPPGRDVRCIVSVGMLTEGWDCSTVTHIVGLRPFMSQLLCEQVIGRGLRRASYQVGEGGLMNEEVAVVLGVPLSAFTIKASGRPPTKRKRYHIYARADRAHYAITFPRVAGYTQVVKQRLTCDMAKVPAVTIDEGRIPSLVEMKAGLLDERGQPSLHGPGGVKKASLVRRWQTTRVQQEIYGMAAALATQYAKTAEYALPRNVLFAQLFRIVHTYFADKVSASPPAEKLHAFLSPYYGEIIDNLHEHIRPDESAGETPELPRYEQWRGPGTTGDVDFFTVREPYDVNKSHINAVVPDTDRLEQAAAYHLDNHPKVAAFAKNAGLGFGIPYLHGGEMHEYIPDFLIRLEHDEERYLILETKGYDPLKDVKRGAAERWVQAVNKEGGYGRWAYCMVSDAEEVAGAVDAVVR